MKSILLTFLSIALLSGCKFSEKTLCTKWHIADVTFKGDISEKEKEAIRSGFMAKKTITFNADHTMQLGDKEAKPWKMSAKADTLYMMEEGNETVILVRKLSEKAALLESKKGKIAYAIHLSPAN